MNKLQNFSLFLIICCWISKSQGSYEINIKYFRCKYYDKYFDMSDCSLSREKSKYGIINGFGHGIHTLDQIYIDLDVQYMNVNTYLVRLRKNDVCTFWSREAKYEFPFKKMILDLMNNFCPDFTGGCPYYSKNYTFNNIDVNAVLSPVIPPVALAGEYQLYLRVFVPKNDTIAEVEVGANLIAKSKVPNIKSIIGSKN